MKQKRTDSMWAECFAAMLILGCLLFAATVVLAQDNNELTINSNNNRTVDRSQEINNESGSNSESVSAADAQSSAAGGGGGSSTVNTKNESTSLVLSGARDTAACFTKVTIGAEGFGIGFSRGDVYCKKIRLITHQLTLENWDAAARMECTLKEWREIYGKDKEACRQALFAGPDEGPFGALIPHEAYHALAENYQEMAVTQVQQEEFDDAVELGEYRFIQQQSLLKELANERDNYDKEIARLKREAAETAAREEEEKTRRSAALAALKKGEI